MTNKEKFKRAFSSVHTDEHFVLDLEDKTMKKNTRIRGSLIAACTALAVVVGGITCYAADVGGIQRTMQIWRDGDLTTATIDFDGGGNYTIHDESGDEIGNGGGIAIGEFGQPDRPLTEEELAEIIADEITIETENGRYYLMWHDQKTDITDDFNDDGYAYITLKDGDQTEYVTLNRAGAYATDPNKYPIPGKDVDLD